MAAGADRLVAVAHLDGVPIGEAFGNGAVGRRVVAHEVAQRLIGEDDAEAEGIVVTVALVNRDVVGRIGLLHQKAEIEPARTAADDREFHLLSSPPGRPWRLSGSILKGPALGFYL